MKITLSCREVLEATGGTLIRGNGAKTFHALSTDSREQAVDGIFIPLKGERFDGHAFLLPAIRNGASGLLVEEGAEDKWKMLPDGITVICVKDTLRALGDLACYWRRRFSLPVVAVTGSSGKTTTKEMVAAITGITKRVLKAKGNRNNLVGLPLTLLEMGKDFDLAVVEMGTNRRGEIARLTTIAEPDVGIITNIGPAHLEGLGSLTAIRDEKGDLFGFMKETGTAIINLDDEATGMLGRRWKGKKVTFGLRKKRHADVTAEDIGKTGYAGMTFTLRLKGTTGRVTLPLTGEHNVSNALAAAAATWALGFDHRLICQGLSALKPLPGRMEIHRLVNGAFLIDDTYNANPASTGEAIKTLTELRGNGCSAVILGDMLELGPEAEDMHARIGELLASSGTATIFLRGQYAEATAMGARRGGMQKDRIHFFDQVDEILSYLREHVKQNDWILVKGSRKAKMEDISAQIISAIGPIPDTGFSHT